MHKAFDVLAVTGCTTGVALTYMAKEALEKAAEQRRLSILVETHGQVGVENALTESQIEGAQAIVVAADKPVELDRFTGKPMVSVAISKVLSVAAAGGLIDAALGLNNLSEVVSTEEDASAGEGAASASFDPDAFVQPDHVFLNQTLKTREELLRYISGQAVRLGFAEDPDALFQSFLDREAEGTTGMMEGFAIPHAKSATVSRASVIVVKDTQGVEGWDTMDGAPVDIAIALLVPAKKAGLTHLKMLSRVAESLMDVQFRKFVRECNEPADIAAAISKRLS